MFTRNQFTVSILFLWLLSCQPNPKDTLMLLPMAMTGSHETSSEIIFSLQSGDYLGKQKLELNTENQQTIHYEWKKITADDIELVSSGEYKTPLLLEVNDTAIYQISAYINHTEKIQFNANYRILSRVLPPTFSLPAGTYINPIAIELIAISKNSKIYYTLDGSQPEPETALLYQNEPIELKHNTTIIAMAIFSDDSHSEIVSQTYQFRDTLSAPEFSHQDGSYQSNFTLLLSCQHPQARIYYTLDGSIPSPDNGILYNGEFAIPINETQRVNAISYLEGIQSEVVSKLYSMQYPQQPVFSHQDTSYSSEFLLKLTGEQDCNIYFSTDGTDPKRIPESLYQSAIPIQSNSQIRAMSCYREAKNCSSIIHRDYTITTSIPVPNLTPLPGDFKKEQQVNIFHDPTVEVYYSLDGSDPLTNGTLYNEQSIPIQKTTILRAIAIDKKSQQKSQSINGKYIIRSLSQDDIFKLYGLANVHYSQIRGGLTAEVLRAQNLVAENPTSIANSEIRQKFLNQNPAKAASELCTSIARYLYLYTYQQIYPEKIINLPEGFAEYYIDAVNKQYVITDSGGVTFNWVANGTAMIEKYMHPDFFSIWDKYRSDAGTDSALLDYASSVAPSIFLLRDGPTSAGGTHTFLAFFQPQQTDYIMLDTYHHTWTDKQPMQTTGMPTPYSIRFGPDGSRWLHIVYGYSKY